MPFTPEHFRVVFRLLEEAVVSRGGSRRNDRSLNRTPSPKLSGLLHDSARGKATEISLWQREVIDQLIEWLPTTPILFTDARGIITSHNAAFKKLLGHSPEDINGRSAGEFIVGRNVGRILARLAEFGRVERWKVTLKTKHGKELPCLLRARVVKSREGRVAGMVGVFVDASRKRKTGSTLSGGVKRHGKIADTISDAAHGRDLALIGLLAATIAHEVKNPLASIRLNMEMLEAELKRSSDERVKTDPGELIAAIMNELDQLDTITRDYLVIARNPARRFRRQCLNRVLKELQDFMRPEMDSRDITFVNAFSSDLPSLYFDKGRFKEAIMNLYKNSAEAMPGGGKIRTATHISGRWVEIVISDTGSGVRNADAAKLFRPFFSTKESGTGLGLPIVRDIMAAHGGTIEFYAKARKGTTFLLRLPIMKSGDIIER
ncbi:MAG: PAS domain-containing protein [Candidatus Abyssobacteria bacterium SURF_17]|uniref:histidine kinase n=1 Tax=Candidatus Abyssobacteria bacterium SURF_17 TaxID=2093361 RepID=A0A419ESX2_9BACT|nr:MAG: PAS domain-containing protein [Candidatus Abyssubacteria bacterium SURF_17]